MVEEAIEITQEIRYTHFNAITRRYHLKRLNIILNKIRLVTKTENTKNLTFLDVGCGDGTYELLLKKDFNYLIGLDITLNDLVIAKKQMKNRNNTDFILADAKHLPFKDLSVDIILCSEVLEHLHDPLKTLSELSRISRGKLLLTVPTMSKSRNIARILQYSNRISEIEADVGHVSMYTSQQWINAVQKTFGKRKAKYHVKADQLYITAEPFASIFANLKNITLLKIIDVSLNIFEAVWLRLKFANQLIIAVVS